MARSNSFSISPESALEKGRFFNGNPPSTDLQINAGLIEEAGDQIRKYAKKLKTLKEDIIRKREKSKSKHLANKEHEYNVNYKALVEVKKDLDTLLPGKVSARGDTMRFDVCRECERKQLKIWKLESDMKKICELEEQVNSLEKQNNEESSAKEEANTRMFNLQRQVTSLENKLAEETASKGDAIRRLSQLDSSKLRDNNPDIADLSDPNRPTKLADHVSELYDNEWTDAFDEMETTSRYSERELIDLLLKPFMNIFDECKRITTIGFFERVQSCIEQSDMIQVTKDNEPVAIPDQLRQQIKDFRKIRAVKTMANVVDGILKQSRFDYFRKPPYNSEKARAYLEKCVELSWMMCVQDPPLVLSVQAPKEFNTALFREYTKRGRYTAYVVWPILYLHDGGPILCKGVAQGSKDIIMDVGYLDPQLKSRTGMSTDMIDAKRNTWARIEHERTPPPADQTFNTNWTGASKHGVSMLQTQYQPKHIAGNQQHASYGDNDRYSSLNATHYPQSNRNTKTARSPVNPTYAGYHTDI